MDYKSTVSATVIPFPHRVFDHPAELGERAA